jgi:hypothetical protein
VALPVAALPLALHPSAEHRSETCASDAFCAHPALAACGIPEVHSDDPAPALRLDEAAGKSVGHARAIPFVVVHLAPSAKEAVGDAAAAPYIRDAALFAEQSCAAQADPDAAQSAAPASVLRAVLRTEAVPWSEQVAEHSGLPPQVQPEFLPQARFLAPKAREFLLAL